MIDVNLNNPDMKQLQHYAKDLAKWMRRQGKYTKVVTSLSDRKLELGLQPDGERQVELDVSPTALTSTVRVLVGGKLLCSYKAFDQNYDVWI
ncbi:MAG: hypothetical protein RMJ88_15780 [Thermogemmata sp.]|nr:hypothetical protein [Thermogemmata sp.]